MPKAGWCSSDREGGQGAQEALEAAPSAPHAAGTAGRGGALGRDHGLAPGRLPMSSCAPSSGLAGGLLCFVLTRLAPLVWGSIGGDALR